MTTKWTPERIRRLVNDEYLQHRLRHSEQIVDDMLDAMLAAADTIESQRAELEALYAACDDASTVIVRSELASECEPATALLGGFFQAVHAIRKHESNPYSDALRTQHTTSGEDAE